MHDYSKSFLSFAANNFPMPPFYRKRQKFQPPYGRVFDMRAEIGYKAILARQYP